MFQRGVFADAVCESQGAKYVIMGVPFDSTSSFRSGSRDGPDAIRRASYCFEPYNYRHDLDLQELVIADLGNLETESDPAFLQECMLFAMDTVPFSATPILLGGEHSITPHAVMALARRMSFGVVVVDAHLDLRDEYGGTRLSHACASRRILETPGISGYSVIGIRSGSREEFLYARDNGIDFFTCDEVYERGMDEVLKDAISSAGGGRIYLSIDLDAIDPSYAPAVGNPEPFGLLPSDVLHIIDRISPLATGLDLVEVTPGYDSGQTALLGAKLACEFMACGAMNRGR